MCLISFLYRSCCSYAVNSPLILYLLISARQTTCICHSPGHGKTIFYFIAPGPYGIRSLWAHQVARLRSLISLQSSSILSLGLFYCLVSQATEIKRTGTVSKRMPTIHRNWHFQWYDINDTIILGFSILALLTSEHTRCHSTTQIMTTEVPPDVATCLPGAYNNPSPLLPTHYFGEPLL